MFPSWIETEDGKIVFSTDALAREKGIPFVDAVGHEGIRKIYPDVKGKDCEGFPCPPSLVKAIMDGECHSLMKAGGYKNIFLNRNGELHREDGPACEYPNGSKHWYRNGERHREDGPACEWADGSKCWYRNGERHREDGPAIEWTDGTKEWWIKGVKRQ
jgi:hypothetical protein